METPSRSMITAAPMTSSSAAAVKTSELPCRAMNLSAGRTATRPTITNTMIAATAVAASVQLTASFADAYARSGRRARSGITMMSWKSSTANASRP
jgi:hypothetical protein